MKILITAGGTREYIDDVRYLTNVSNGTIGRELAYRLAMYDVTLLLSVNDKRPIPPEYPTIDVRQFITTEDLMSQIKELSEQSSWDMVFHCSAVSDYRPVRVDGKISSDSDELVLKMEKTPKILSFMRQWFGRQTFIVGFKLLSGSTPDKLAKASFSQIEKNRTNLCIGNDLSDVTGTSHKATIFTPEGGIIGIERSDKQGVAQSIAEFATERYRVCWFETKYVNDGIAKSPSSNRMMSLLNFCQLSGLLRDKNGNCSVRLYKDEFAITPRGVDKRTISSDDTVCVESIDFDNHIINAINCGRKPSIDSSVSGRIYRDFPNIEGIIHTHNKWVVGPMVSTRFPYPCGVVEEGIDVCAALRRAINANTMPILHLVKMPFHGVLLAIEEIDDTMTILRWQLANMLTDFNRHMSEISRADIHGILLPIISKNGIVGHVMEHSDGTVSPRLMKQHRGLGYGIDLINIIKNNGLIVKTVDECGVMDFYSNYGFEVISRVDDGTIHLASKISA